MSVAVMYLSETGNTKALAEQFYITLPNGDKSIHDISIYDKPPKADLYYIGYPVHRQTCPVKVLDLVKQIEDAGVAFFATCGMPPEKGCRYSLEQLSRKWVNDSCTYYGFFLCQGKV